MQSHSSRTHPNTTCRVCGKPFYRSPSQLLPQGNSCSKHCAYIAMGIRQNDDSFWSRVDRREPDECWPWLGARRGRMGYGLFGFKHRRAVPAHRMAYLLSKGDIPKGMFVCHSCDNPPCCNPAHLWLGTHADNMADRHAKGRDQHIVKLVGERIVRLSDETLASLERVRKLTGAETIASTISLLADRYESVSLARLQS